MKRGELPRENQHAKSQDNVSQAIISRILYENFSVPSASVAPSDDSALLLLNVFYCVI